VGSVEQHGALANQPGYVVVLADRHGEGIPQELSRISHAIWHDYLVALDRRERELRADDD
jgi:hypothetical protein